MSDADRADYAEAVWEAWRHKRGGGRLCISPSEYVLISRLLREEIPLRIALRGIKDCAGKLRPSTPLTYAAGSVTQAVNRWVNAI